MPLRPLALAAALAAAPLVTRAAPDEGGAARRATGVAEAPRGSPERLAREVAALVGAQLSPLFMLAVHGGVRWVEAPAARRAGLPWHQRPWFWGGALAVVVLLWAGDKVPGLRHLVKHLRLVESKVSGLLAAGVLSSSFAGEVEGLLREALAAAPGLLVPAALAASGDGAAGGAASDLAGGAASDLAGGAAWAAAWVTAFLASAVVWLAGHTVNVLVLLSPFAPLDWALRTARLALGLAVMGLVHASAGLGAGLALVYLAVALLVAPWAFRLLVLGSVFSFDFLLGREVAPGAAPAAFAGPALRGVPRRAYGRVVSEGGALVFRWRPWLVLRARTVAVPPPSAVGEGLLSPVLLREGERGREVLARFPPRHRRHERALAAALGGLPVVDVSILRGLRAALAWLRGEAVAR